MSESNPRSVANFFRAKQCSQGVLAICPEFSATKQPAVPVEKQVATARSELREFGIAAGMWLGVILVIAAVRYYKHCEHEAWKMAQYDDIKAAVYRHESAQIKKLDVSRLYVNHVSWNNDSRVFVQGIYHPAFAGCSRYMSWHVVFRDNQWIVAERN